MLDTLIIGAGISGLSLAGSFQHNRSRQILVTERSDRIGGRITTGKVAEFLWEEGANSFSPTPALLKLAVDAGLKQELVLADRRLPRYVYWHGQLHAVPMSPLAAVTSQLLSWRGKLRAIAGIFGFVAPAMGDRLSQQEGEETVAQFFSRHLGAEVTERLVAPFTSGVYAGDIEQLSASAAFGRVTQLADVGGGLLAGAMLGRSQRKKAMQPTDPRIPKTKPGELGSFKQGLQSLPEALASQLGNRVKLLWELTSLHPTERQTYLANFATPDGQEQVEARTLVLTTPADVTADLLQPLQPKISQALREIPYPAVGCVVLAYPEDALRCPLYGFGNLIPRGQGIRTLGTIWSSALFCDRAPQGWQLLTNFIGGATDPEIADLDAEQIVREVHNDLRRILLRADVPPKVLAVHLWKRAIPQYTLGHHRRLHQINQGLQQFPGLYLCGNYISGVSLGDCVQSAQQQAAEISDYLQQMSGSREP